MAKITPVELVKSMSGKVCMHSDTYFRTNPVTGKVYSAKLCNPYDGGNSTDQVSARNRFAAVVVAVRQRITALSATEKAALVAAWKADGKIGSFFGYCMKKWNSEYNSSGQLISND